MFLCKELELSNWFSMQSKKKKREFVTVRSGKEAALAMMSLLEQHHHL